MSDIEEVLETAPLPGAGDAFLAVPPSEEHVLECRFCHGSHAPWDMIHACSCQGPVHRVCLDRWRAISPDEKSFARCEVCLRDYEFEVVPGQDEKVCNPVCLFRLVIARDILLLLLLSFLVMALFGWVFVPLMDRTGWRYGYFPAGWSRVGDDLLCGMLLFFATIGVVGLVVIAVRLCCWCWCCCQCCYAADDRHYSRPHVASSYPSYGWDMICCYWCYPIPTYRPYPPAGGPPPSPVDGSACVVCDCHGCGGCGGGGGCDGGEVLVVVLVVLAILGFLFAVAFLSFLGARYAYHFSKIVHQYRSALKHRVRDIGPNNLVAVVEMQE